jgi:regulator of protease activity HflC (stomatin/prohibitin superfamily)
MEGDKRRAAARKSAGIASILIVILLFGTFYIVPAGYRGVLLTFGKPSMEARQEGLGVKVPLIQTVKKLEVRKQKIEVIADSASLDLQDVQTTIALNFHLSPASTPKLYQEVGFDYSNRIIHPSIQETVKAVTANYKAEELITKRPAVRDDIKEGLRVKLQKYYIIVDDFNIVNFQFSEEFDKAIESKVTAEQLKLKADRDLERIKIEKLQKITRAEAEAKALRLQKQEITPELVRLRQIEMMMKAIEKWDGHLPQATSGMPFIDVTPPSIKNQEYPILTDH